MAPNLFHQIFGALLLLLVLQLHLIECRPVKLESLQNLKQAQKGDTLKGLNQVKHFLKAFGYYTINGNDNDNVIEDDHFDEYLESALQAYQKFYNLEVTGKIDSNTIKAITTPRCGVPDIIHNHNYNQTYSGGEFNMIAGYSFFNNSQKWRRFNLTYNFPLTAIPVVSLQVLGPVIDRAFKRWERVSSFRFRNLSPSQIADLKISFERGNHGDSLPFDGRGGKTAHAYAPENGNFHYDADESWSANPNQNEMDLESIAVHEIGHLLGLYHSQDPDAIMYAYLEYGHIKRELTQDDINGIQALYA